MLYVYGLPYNIKRASPGVRPDEAREKSSLAKPPAYLPLNKLSIQARLAFFKIFLKVYFGKINLKEVNALCQIKIMTRNISTLRISLEMAKDIMPRIMD